MDRAEFALLLNRLRDERGPAGLMRRVQAGAGRREKTHGTDTDRGHACCSKAPRAVSVK
jgi:hypothetical protein